MPTKQKTKKLTLSYDVVQATTCLFVMLDEYIAHNATRQDMQNVMTTLVNLRMHKYCAVPTDCYLAKYTDDFMAHTVSKSELQEDIASAFGCLPAISLIRQWAELKHTQWKPFVTEIMQAYDSDANTVEFDKVEDKDLIKMLKPKRIKTVKDMEDRNDA